VPTGLRRGQTLQILLALSDETHQVLLPKSGFYQQTGSTWILNAYKTDIQLAGKIQITIKYYRA
jgi:HlyD family secretion protein